MHESARFPVAAAQQAVELTLQRPPMEMIYRTRPRMWSRHTVRWLRQLLLLLLLLLALVRVLARPLAVL
jgi:hypothetical protein